MKKMRILIFILITIALSSCTLKPVKIVYYEDKDVTSFTTRPLIIEKDGNEIEMVAVKECRGKVICEDQEIKLTITHIDRFSFLKGKDLILEIDQEKINLNERDYSQMYDMNTKAKDGTDGVLKEIFLIWVSGADFHKAAYAQTGVLKVGDDYFELSSEARSSWQIMLDKNRLLETMEKEQQREYGLYPHEKKDLKKITVQEKRMTSAAEEATWKLVKDSNNLEDLRYFLGKYPESPYAIPAKLRINQLERDQG